MAKANPLRRPLKLVWRRGPTGLKDLAELEYNKQFKGDDSRRTERAFEKAWEIRNFEIEMYWKRATYFWAFIASALVGYFALTEAENYAVPDPNHHAEVYFVICIGFLLALAWHLTNRGSKQWQRNWETHVDLLEDAFTGPLYKTVHSETTFSVSKLNEIVTVAFMSLWVMSGAKYFADQNLFGFSWQVNWFVLVATVATGLFAMAMVFGHGRGLHSERTVRMYRRSVVYDSPGGPPAFYNDDKAMGDSTHT